MIEVYLLIMAVANLITEQKIARDVLNKIFKIEKYMEFGPVKKFIWDALSCGPCASFWIGLIGYTILGYSGLEAIKIGLIAMFIYAVIEKMRIR
jgi:hypothetical protein